MTHEQRILQLLETRPDLCDDCITQELAISRRQTVYAVCKKADRIIGVRGETDCTACGQNKLVRRLGSRSVTADKPAKKLFRNGSATKNKTADVYSRELSLQKLFNAAVINVLKLETKDYYGELTFSELLTLKTGYARIHDIITLKLTVALANWIGKRLELDDSKFVELIDRINATHPNAAGFDIDCRDPNIIAEVKGLVPVNDGERFGAAQLRGLKEDLHGMLGIAIHGKPDDQLKKKAQRPDREGALKFLGLIDNDKVRAAAESWAQRQMKALSVQIREASSSGKLLPNVIYLVYLKA